MIKLLVLTGTDPDSKLGGIAFALPGYMRALDFTGINWVMLPTHHPVIFGGKWKLCLFAFFKLIRLIRNARKVHAKVVVYSHAGAGFSLFRKFFILLISRLLGAVTILQLHAPEVDEYLANSLKRWLFRMALAPAMCVGVLTPWWRSRLIEAGVNKRLYVIPNPLPFAWETLARMELPKIKRSNKIRLLCMARLVSGKGVEFVIEAMLFLSVEFQLVVAGEGPLHGQLVKRVSELQLGNRVRFVGWVTGETKQRLFDESDIFVLPSQYDSFGMGFMEAMANGLPVIASKFGPIADVVPNGLCGILVENDPEVVAAAIFSLRGEELRYQMGIQCQRWVLKQFSAAVVGGKITTMLDHVKN